MATVVQVFGHDLPEAASVQVGGTLAFSASARWPEGTWQAKPVLRDFTRGGPGHRAAARRAVAGRRAARSAGDAAPLAGWLPRALVAAEDARFYEHPGYELDHMLAAWQHNQRDGAPLRGGSTLTQQLAKFTITGDDRSATRKLRELLYAVEMERTLGKARILQLYLALAPWGDGVCGAERAAQVYLGKSASKVGPVSAAWLVSLLRNPEAQLQRATRAREIDRERVKQIVAGMRPMSAAQRTLANEQMPNGCRGDARRRACQPIASAARWRSPAARTPPPAAAGSSPRRAPPPRRCGAIVTAGGATPRIVISSRPCGGSSRPSCMQIRNITPNQTGSMRQRLHDRHEDRQRDHHHADLVDEDAEEDQHQHHRRPRWRRWTGPGR